jgi:hypothetical protein
MNNIKYFYLLFLQLKSSSRLKKYCAATVYFFLYSRCFVFKKSSKVLVRHMLNCVFISHHTVLYRSGIFTLTMGFGKTVFCLDILLMRNQGWIVYETSKKRLCPSKYSLDRKFRNKVFFLDIGNGKSEPEQPEVKSVYWDLLDFC